MSIVSGAAVAPAFAFGSSLQAMAEAINTRHNAGDSRVVHFIYSPMGKLIMTSFGADSMPAADQICRRWVQLTRH